MKDPKVTIPLVLLLFIGKIVLAQQIEAELLVRPALTSLRGNEPIEELFDPALHLSGGIGFNYISSANTAIHLALLVDRKGATSTYSAGQTIKSVYDYVTIPVQYGQRFGKKVKFQFGIGFYASFLQKHRLISESENSSLNSESEDTKAFKSFDLGVAGSFSTFIPVSKVCAIKLGIDDHLGIFDTTKEARSDGGTTQHNSFGVHAGLNFKLYQQKDNGDE